MKNGQAALVSGVNRGIGREVVRQLAARTARSRRVSTRQCGR